MDRSRKYFAFAEEYFIFVSGYLREFDDKEIRKYVRILERYKFKGRRKTDPKHSNTKRNHLVRKRSDNTTAMGLARATLRLMDPKYNALTANNTRLSLIELIKEKHPKLF